MDETEFESEFTRKTVAASGDKAIALLETGVAARRGSSSITQATGLSIRCRCTVSYIVCAILAGWPRASNAAGSRTSFDAADRRISLPGVGEARVVNKGVIGQGVQKGD